MRQRTRGWSGWTCRHRHLSEAVWIDLESPTEAEEDAVEAALGIDIPTREDMQEIEVSSRIYARRARCS